MTDSDDNDRQLNLANARPLLAVFLSDRDEPCPLCGYNLRDLQVDRCPECGRKLRLTIGLIEPALGLWLATLISLLLPAAFGLFFIIIFLFALVKWPRSITFRHLAEWPLPIDFILLHTLLCVPLAATVLARRRRFLRRPRSIQRLAAIAGWGTIMVSILCLFYMWNR